MIHVSGILVLTTPQAVPSCIERLEGLPGVEVHHHHATSGRIVVVQETASLDAQQEGLGRIQALPEVEAAALVHHLWDETLETEPPGAPP